jgi:hypothetical protein
MQRGVSGSHVTTPEFPNFFIVGAPRCASTFMYAYLRQHPDVFMPDNKDPRFFCSDLDSGSDADAEFFMRDEAEYLALFADTGGAKRVGEACQANLYSTVAAGRIKAKSPDARIIIMLREPVEQMYSFHSVRRRNATEDLDFEQALAAEEDRRAGRRLPRLARNIKMYQYRAVASYTDQVARYFDTFGRDNVHVIIYEDLIRDPAEGYRHTLEFLGLDTDFRPEFEVINANTANLSPGLATLLGDPQLAPRLKRLLPAAMHRRAQAVLTRLAGANRRPAPRPPLSSSLRQRLRTELAPEVQRLSELLGRDLTTVW